MLHYLHYSIWLIQFDVNSICSIWWFLGTTKRRPLLFHVAKAQDEVEHTVEDAEASPGPEGFVNWMTDVDRRGVEGSEAGANDGAEAVHQHGLSHGVVISWRSTGVPVANLAKKKHAHTHIYV